MRVTVTPHPLHPCTIHIPASKSLSHRALIAAALSSQTSVIENLVDNEDTQATMRTLKQLGADFEKHGNQWFVKGCNGHISYQDELLDCGESGSTMRFLIPVFAALCDKSTFTGHGRLMERPMSVYEELFAKEGLSFSKEGSKLRVQGKLEGMETEIRGDVSSQFISGLLFALPMCRKDSVLHIREPYESRSYVTLTIDALEKAGIVILEKGNDLYIPGHQTYHPFHTCVEGDESQAAFFGVLSAISHVPLKAGNMAEVTRQGDRVYKDVLKRCGCECVYENGWQFRPGTLKSTTVDLADCPDLGPVLFTLATQCEGTTTFVHAGRLRIKESDRIACMEEELTKLGCVMHSTRDTVIVEGKTPVHGNVTLNGHNDHRIVMALSVLACMSDGPVNIEGAQAVSKSYPDFFEDLARTGIQVKKDAE